MTYSLPTIALALLVLAAPAHPQGLNVDSMTCNPGSLCDPDAQAWSPSKPDIGPLELPDFLEETRAAMYEDAIRSGLIPKIVLCGEWWERWWFGCW